MDELQISGKRYLSSRRVAKENGYHTDYIGQLIRGGKVKGQKVGRTWYVEEDSFAAYLTREPAFVEVPAAPIAPTQPVAQQVEVQPVAAAPVPIVQQPVPVAAPQPIAYAHSASYIPSAPLQSAPVASAPTPAPAAAPASFVPPAVAAAPVQAQAPVETQEVEIPIRKVQYEAPQSSSVGLRYVAHEEPLLPEIPRNERVTRMMPQEEERPTAVIGHDTIESSQRAPLGRLALGFGAVGIAIFIFSAVVSSGLIQNINIQEGNPANVSYGLHW